VGGEGADAGLLAQLIELDGEQAVGRLGLAVGLPFVMMRRCGVRMAAS
jgi:hypothetical protein